MLRKNYLLAVKVLFYVAVFIIIGGILMCAWLVVLYKEGTEMNETSEICEAKDTRIEMEEYKTQIPKKPGSPHRDEPFEDLLKRKEMTDHNIRETDLSSLDSSNREKKYNCNTKNSLRNLDARTDNPSVRVILNPEDGPSDLTFFTAPKRKQNFEMTQNVVATTDAKVNSLIGQTSSASLRARAQAIYTPDTNPQANFLQSSSINPSVKNSFVRVVGASEESKTQNTNYGYQIKEDKLHETCSVEIIDSSNFDIEGDCGHADPADKTFDHSTNLLRITPKDIQANMDESDIKVNDDNNLVFVSCKKIRINPTFNANNKEVESFDTNNDTALEMNENEFSRGSNDSYGKNRAEKSKMYQVHKPLADYVIADQADSNEPKDWQPHTQIPEQVATDVVPDVKLEDRKTNDEEKKNTPFDSSNVRFVTTDSEVRKHFNKGDKTETQHPDDICVDTMKMIETKLTPLRNPSAYTLNSVLHTQPWHEVSGNREIDGMFLNNEKVQMLIDSKNKNHERLTHFLTKALDSFEDLSQGELNKSHVKEEADPQKNSDSFNGVLNIDEFFATETDKQRDTGEPAQADKSSSVIVLYESAVPSVSEIEMNNEGKMSNRCSIEPCIATEENFSGIEEDNGANTCKAVLSLGNSYDAMQISGDESTHGSDKAKSDGSNGMDEFVILDTSENEGEFDGASDADEIMLKVMDGFKNIKSILLENNEAIKNAIHKFKNKE